jgi:phosphohistidine phosphatase
MNLYLLRHGIAADIGEAGITQDSQRPLTAEGIAKLKRGAAAMRALELKFDVILSSPFVRARETAELVAGALHAQDRLKLEPGLACGGEMREVIRRLATRKPAPDSALLVGHEPDLSRLISLLVSGDAGFPVTMRKGGFCKLSATPLLYGRCATLELLLTPKQMGLMG